MFRKKPRPLISPSEALPGRNATMPVPEAHLVFGTPLTPPFPAGFERATFAMGCFWGAEKFLWQVPGVYTSFVGYAGGFTPNPTYEEVCSEGTGHAEAAVVIFDPAKCSYDDLLKVFWENHDPTQWMRQGNDIGSQYRSAIYTHSEEQAAQAVASRDRYQAAIRAAGFGDIVTEVAPAGTFYYAEPYHQQYLKRYPFGYCNHGFCQASYPGAEAPKLEAVAQ
jgi:peptide-methionine (S)-S-oxide reductase